MRHFDCEKYEQCLLKAARINLDDMACPDCDGTLATALQIMNTMTEKDRRRRWYRRQFDLDGLEVGESTFFAARGKPPAKLRARVCSILHHYKPKRFVVALSTDSADGVVCERVA